jgi:UDP-glucose 4-epimerase
MNILVVGGLGYVGGRIAVRLKAEGHNVTLASRSKGYDNAKTFGFSIRSIDWSSCESLRFACRGCDFVVHAAGLNAAECALDPPMALLINGFGTASLVEAAVDEGAKKFIYLSTAHVYKSPLDGDIDEYTAPINLHPYATSHLAGEHSLSYASSLGKIDGISLRLSNCFGAPAFPSTSCWTLVVNSMCREVIQERSITLKTSGQQQRDFVSLTTVCQDVCDLLGNSSTAVNKVLNIGSGNSLTLLEIASIVQERCASRYGYIPIINAGIRVESSKPLKYNSLYMSQFRSFDVNMTAEIDKTLDYCANRFLNEK